MRGHLYSVCSGAVLTEIIELNSIKLWLHGGFYHLPHRQRAADPNTTTSLELLLTSQDICDILNNIQMLWDSGGVRDLGSLTNKLTFLTSPLDNLC